MDNINKLAESIRLVYEQYHTTLDIPFFSHFPVNCCEGASFFFGHIAQDCFPNSTIEIVKGRRIQSGCTEYHYWIECQDKIFDLTSDQFDTVHTPIYGADRSQKHMGFKTIKREYISCYLLYYLENCIEAERFFVIRNAITKK